MNSWMARVRVEYCWALRENIRTKEARCNFFSSPEWLKFTLTYLGSLTEDEPRVESVRGAYIMLSIRFAQGSEWRMVWISGWFLSPTVKSYRSFQNGGGDCKI